MLICVVFYGVRQRYKISQILFILFLNELCIDIIQKYACGIFLTQEIENMMLLLSCNDIVLFDYTNVGLQRQLNILVIFHEIGFCSEFGLKTLIIIFFIVYKSKKCCCFFV